MSGDDEVLDEPLLTPSDVARMTSRSASTVRGWERAGLLPALRTARGNRLFRLRDVRRLLSERATRTAARGRPDRAARAEGGK